MAIEPTRVPLESSLAPEHLEKFEAFAQSIVASDKTSAFSEQTQVALRQASKNQDNSARLFYVLEENQEITGAWVLVEPQDDEPGVLEGAVAASSRVQGIASSILNYLENEAKIDFSRYNAWVHQVLDDLSGTIASATSHLSQKLGYQPVRDLRKMRLDLTDDVRQKLTSTPVDFASGNQLSVFDKDQDADAWVALNAEAFSSHPEQGKLTRSDLEERLSSDWFRADGFFMLHGTNKPTGYIWIKIPTGQTENYEGEIYAVGVSPSAQGQGLGRALTTSALAHLATTEYEPGTGLDAAVLYVDADNTAAVALYESLGFVNETVDVMYSRN